MEQWEIDRRAEYENTFEDKLYDLYEYSGGALVGVCGKQRMIDFEIELERRMR